MSLLTMITDFDPKTALVAFLMTATLIAVGVYMLRGQGPTNKVVNARMAAEQHAARARRDAANHAGFYAAQQAQAPQQWAPSAAQSDSSTGAAQVNAIASQETAKALQNLQSLLYTRTISDDEFQAAKDKLFRNAASVDPYAQIEKLAELHRSGLIGDIEFANAKARVLGL